jgi:hypothetical protein
MHWAQRARGSLGWVSAARYRALENSVEDNWQNNVHARLSARRLPLTRTV